MAAVKEELDGLAFFGAVAPRPVVDVHADEPVGAGTVEPPRIAHRVGQGRLTVSQAVLDRARERAGDAGDPLGAEIPPDDVAAERERQSRLLLPPAAEDHDL